MSACPAREAGGTRDRQREAEGVTEQGTVEAGERRPIGAILSQTDQIAPQVSQIVRACAFGVPQGPARSETLEDIRLALTEVLNNCIRHGYGGEGGQPIRVALSISAGRIRITVSDRGKPLPPDLLEGPAALPDPRALESLPESGWGWFLIRQSVDAVDYRREQGWNHLTLEKRI